jgi:hypothetical protein
MPDNHACICARQGEGSIYSQPAKKDGLPGLNHKAAFRIDLKFDGKAISRDGPI